VSNVVRLFGLSKFFSLSWNTHDFFVGGIPQILHNIFRKFNSNCDEKRQKKIEGRILERKFFSVFFDFSWKIFFSQFLRKDYLIGIL